MCARQYLKKGRGALDYIYSVASAWKNGRQFSPHIQQNVKSQIKKIKGRYLYAFITPN